ncbi:MAG: ribulose-phosphate 3-epimerase [Thermomicrobiales bacterium]
MPENILLQRPVPRLAPSILDSDLANLAEQVSILERNGIDTVHVDVMDGRFVPNISIGIPVVASLRQATSLTLDVHLMIQDPEDYVTAFVEAGADSVTVHPESTPHVHRALDRIRDAGAMSGLALNPGTPLAHAIELLPVLDLVLIMSINPGFGGQSFKPEAIDRLQKMRAAIDQSDRPVALEVDGGINPETIGPAVDAGVDLIVSGSAIFKHPDGPEAGIEELVGRLSSR